MRRMYPESARIRSGSQGTGTLRGKSAQEAFSAHGRDSREKEFKCLLESVQTRLYNFILKSVCGEDLAHDIFQDTVLRALKYWHTFDRSRNFSAWIFTVAVNCIKKNYRIRQAFNRRLSGVQTDRLPEEPEDPLLLKIYEIARELKPGARQVFFLYYYNRFSIGEISAITGLKEGNVKFILSCSRDRIRAEWEEKSEK